MNEYPGALPVRAARWYIPEWVSRWFTCTSSQVIYTWMSIQVITTETTGLPLRVVMVAGFSNIPVIYHKHAQPHQYQQTPSFTSPCLLLLNNSLVYCSYPSVDHVPKELFSGQFFLDLFSNTVYCCYHDYSYKVLNTSKKRKILQKISSLATAWRIRDPPIRLAIAADSVAANSPMTTNGGQTFTDCRKL